MALWKEIALTDLLYSFPVLLFCVNLICLNVAILFLLGYLGYMLHNVAPKMLSSALIRR